MRLNEVFFFACSLREEEVEAVKVKYTLWNKRNALTSDDELGKAALSLARAFVRPLGADHVQIPVHHPSLKRWGLIETPVRVNINRDQYEAEEKCLFSGSNFIFGKFYQWTFCIKSIFMPRASHNSNL